ncbi:unnamed protein product [Sphacelaria rigidula]
MPQRRPQLRQPGLYAPCRRNPAVTRLMAPQDNHSRASPRRASSLPPHPPSQSKPLQPAKTPSYPHKLPPPCSPFTPQLVLRCIRARSLRHTTSPSPLPDENGQMLSLYPCPHLCPPTISTPLPYCASTRCNPLHPSSRFWLSPITHVARPGVLLPTTSPG